MLELVDREDEIWEIRAEINEMETKEKEQPPQQIYTYIYKELLKQKMALWKNKQDCPTLQY
jgi:Ni,Fe-hydrogenase III component G